MKCPKCGAEMRGGIDGIGNYVWICLKCRWRGTEREVEIKRYMTEVLGLHESSGLMLDLAEEIRIEKV